MNTRVAVPLTKEAYDAVTFLAKVGGTSRGRLLADTIEAAIPSLIKVADAFRLAQQLEGEERASLLRSFEQSEKYLLDALSVVDGSPLPFQKGSASPASGAFQVPGADEADPPITNRGVPSPDQGGSK